MAVVAIGFGMELGRSGSNARFCTRGTAHGLPIYKVGTQRKILTEDIVRFIRIEPRTSGAIAHDSYVP